MLVFKDKHGACIWKASCIVTRLLLPGPFTPTIGGRQRGLLHGTSGQDETVFLHHVIATKLTGCDGDGTWNQAIDFQILQLACSRYGF